MKYLLCVHTDITFLEHMRSNNGKVQGHVCLFLLSELGKIHKNVFFFLNKSSNMKYFAIKWICKNITFMICVKPRYGYSAVVLTLKITKIEEIRSIWNILYHMPLWDCFHCMLFN